MERRHDVCAMSDYRYLEHTADIGVIAEGKTQAEAYESAALGLENLVTDTSNVRPVLKRDIDLTSTDSESLLVDFLNELVYLFDTQMLVFSRFEITGIGATYLKAAIYGETIDPNRHQVLLGIKAATYHQVRVSHNAKWHVQVIFDI